MDADKPWQEFHATASSSAAFLTRLARKHPSVFPVLLLLVFMAQSETTLTKCYPETSNTIWDLGCVELLSQNVLCSVDRISANATTKCPHSPDARPHTKRVRNLTTCRQHTVHAADVGDLYVFKSNAGKILCIRTFESLGPPRNGQAKCRHYEQHLSDVCPASVHNSNTQPTTTYTPQRTGTPTMAWTAAADNRSSSTSTGNTKVSPTASTSTTMTSSNRTGSSTDLEAQTSSRKQDIPRSQGSNNKSGQSDDEGRLVLIILGILAAFTISLVTTCCYIRRKSSLNTDRSGNKPAVPTQFPVILLQRNSLSTSTSSRDENTGRDDVTVAVQATSPPDAAFTQIIYVEKAESSFTKPDTSSAAASASFRQPDTAPAASSSEQVDTSTLPAASSHRRVYPSPPDLPRSQEVTEEQIVQISEEIAPDEDFILYLPNANVKGEQAFPAHSLELERIKNDNSSAFHRIIAALARWKQMSILHKCGMLYDCLCERKYQAVAEKILVVNNR